jgi:hypothetical protein
MRRALYGLALGAMVLLSGETAAHAYHDEDERLTDGSPGVLRPWESRIGLWRHALGLPSGTQVGTHSWPWLLWAMGMENANLQAKWQFLRSGPWSASAEAGLVYWKPLSEDGATVSFWLVPLEAQVELRANRWLSLGAGVQYTHVSLGGEFHGERFFLDSAVAASNLVLLARAEVRLSRITALMVQGRLLGYMDTSAYAFTRLQVDRRTTATLAVEAGADVLGPGDAGSVLVALDFSWSAINLHVGASIGDITVPFLNFIVPGYFVVPEVDFFVRF